MRRVLTVIQTPVYGGPHNQVLRLYDALAEAGWETQALLPDEEGNGRNRLAERGVVVHTIPFHRARARWAPGPHLRYTMGFVPDVARIRRVVRSEKIDLVQVCGLMNIQGGLAGKLEGKPVVWQLLSTFAPMIVRRLCMPAVVRLSNCVMTTGVTVARAHPGALRLQDRLVPFFPPVDMSRVRSTESLRNKARAELGVGPGQLLVGTVGNLNRQKAHEYFVTVAASVAETWDNVAFRILGRFTPSNAAYYQSKVRALADRHGLTADGRLTFTDPGSRVTELLPAFDVFLLTSIAEGVPTVILEAMACGVPVVATDVGAVSEVVDDGVTGFVVPPKDTEALTSAMLRLIADDDLRESMGMAGRKRAETQYDIKACAEQHLKAFEIAGQHSARLSRTAP